MNTVCLVFPNGNRKEVILSVVPRTGEGIRLRNGHTSDSSLVVEYVMHETGMDGKEPVVLVAVRERANEPAI